MSAVRLELVVACMSAAVAPQPPEQATCVCARVCARVCRCRAFRYDIRLGMAADSGEVPFSFLDHAQRKILVPEVCADSYPDPDQARMAALFTRIQR